jgi:hypothetical protein
LKYHGLKENPKNVAAVLGVNFFWKNMTLLKKIIPCEK